MNEIDTAMIALMAENDNLRAQLLQAPDAKMVAFMAAWEIHLADGILSYGRSNKTGRALLEVQREYNELKAQHLGDEKESEDDEQMR